MRVAHSYALQTPGIMRLITLFYIGSVNYDQIYQTGVYTLSRNLSLGNFGQMNLHYTHLRTVPGSLDKKPAVWFEELEILLGA